MHMVRVQVRIKVWVLVGVRVRFRVTSKASFKSWQAVPAGVRMHILRRTS